MSLIWSKRHFWCFYLPVFVFSLHCVRVRVILWFHSHFVVTLAPSFVMFVISSVQNKRVSCLSRIIFFIRSEAGCVTERPTVAVFALSAKISCQPYETVLYVLCARVCIPVCSSHVRLSFLRSGWIDYDCRFDQVGYEKANNACACCFLTKTAWGRRAMGTRNERREGVKRKN